LPYNFRSPCSPLFSVLFFFNYASIIVALPMLLILLFLSFNAILPNFSFSSINLLSSSFIFFFLSLSFLQNHLYSLVTCLFYLISFHLISLFLYSTTSFFFPLLFCFTLCFRPLSLTSFFCSIPYFYFNLFFLFLPSFSTRLSLFLILHAHSPHTLFPSLTTIVIFCLSLLITPISLIPETEVLYIYIYIY